MFTLALLAALATATGPVWISLTMADGRGVEDRIEVLTPGGVGKPLAARRTVTFLGTPSKVDWADGQSCPGLASSVAGLNDLKPFEGETIVPAETPSPPPPHMMRVTVQVHGATLHGRPGSAVGIWTQGLLEGLEPCWRPAPLP